MYTCIQYTYSHREGLLGQKLVVVFLPASGFCLPVQTVCVALSACCGYCVSLDRRWLCLCLHAVGVLSARTDTGCELVAVSARCGCFVSHDNWRFGCVCQDRRWLWLDLLRIFSDFPFYSRESKRRTGQDKS